ncbi:MAG: protease complex subunit PrcB family protein [Candidatus Diapherotrites archaeon]|uniref:Protease complex subunit PrcB family protein n=1 Tax=Candidatus Iainarchaeum sp. TaxID=3101447 RepID=A0A8T4KTG0_9ARCH|nr:protease complex subunit PrcB family protein [Candidatus Diapherotrites archaeon]HLD38782.1 protease complex subunit PrcB family protein [archaeon]
MKIERKCWVYVGVVIIILGSIGIYLNQYSTSEKQQQFAEITFKTLAEGVSSSHTTFDALVVQNGNEFESLWKGMYSGFRPPPDMPIVDFSNKTVIAVFFGEKPSTGYSITIDNIIRINQSINVQYKTSRPGSGTVGLLVTRPYHIVELDKITEEVKFEEMR